MQLSESSSIVCNAAPERVFGIIRDSARWPELFEPCRAVTHLRKDDGGEHIRVCATVNGLEMEWESRRTFLPDVYGIDVESVKPMALVRDMATSWRVIVVNQQQSLLVLEHVFTLADPVAGVVDGVDDNAAAEAFVRRAIRSNSLRELRSIKAATEQPDLPREPSRAFSTMHAIVCDAPAQNVYDALKDVGNWPLIIDACTSATVVSREHDAEVVRIDAIQGGLPVSWETHRTYRPEIFRIDFHLRVPMPLLERMGGQWRVVPLSDRRCVLHVTRDFLVKADVTGIRPDIADVAAAVDFIREFTCRNGESEMGAIRSFVERQRADCASFETRHSLPFPPDKVYDVLADVASWPDVLPHCERIDILHDDTVNQEFLLTIAAERGGERFRSIRRCDANALSIRYFQPEPPALLRAHEGEWRVVASAAGCEVISAHRIRIDEDMARQAFGSADLRENKARISALIARNSQAAVDACGAWLQRTAMEAA
ncbi:SRPBCC family protein [Burkholderia sp. AU30280]|uniref:aromatase/cyclase n=1 Tax=Burkholderia sp. AU30280 TaxID=2879628 RepID=UPI001CF15A87|nr:SRPBCC family protein [Burkholderia sp. AU30280]MCA8277169.1 SRPBCC family protein [Burkholderia sp. AU30280]